jgi:hypothetical protein
MTLGRVGLWQEEEIEDRFLAPDTALQNDTGLVMHFASVVAEILARSARVGLGPQS